MESHSFAEFFTLATGSIPYSYQVRMACENSVPISQEGAACESKLIVIPTGLGKTAAASLSWLWNRLGHPNCAHRATWPRRLVYCLPMRTLVEQTRDEIRAWVDKLSAANLLHGAKPRVVILMGGEEIDAEARDWDIHPEAETILIGTLNANDSDASPMLWTSSTTPLQFQPSFPLDFKKMPRGNSLFAASTLRTHLNFNETPGRARPSYINKKSSTLRTLLTKSFLVATDLTQGSIGSCQPSAMTVKAARDSTTICRLEIRTAKRVMSSFSITRKPTRRKQLSHHCLNHPLT